VHAGGELGVGVEMGGDVWRLVAKVVGSGLEGWQVA
jgi:hypothetical protein